MKAIQTAIQQNGAQNGRQNGARRPASMPSNEKPGRSTGEAANLAREWRTDPRWRGVIRTYAAEKVLSLRGTLKIEHTIADEMSRKLWHLLQTESFVPALGALSGNQAVQMAQAGLQAIYLSGWQVAADANLAGSTYPDQSLYPANSVPMVVHRINRALQRADQIRTLK